MTADALELFYPERDVDKSQSITIPNIGHNINFHHGRLEVFEKMVGWLEGIGVRA